MAISIAWGTKVINVPKSYLTNISGTLYELDTEQFRLDLKDLEDSEEGMAHLDTHRHNTEVTIAGVTYARTIEIINGYSITFEDGYYSVRLVGSNNNIFDIQSGILNQNLVQVIPTNSAGLIVHTSGSGVTAQDKLDIADRVWDELLAGHIISGSTAKALSDALKAADISDIADGVWDNQLATFIRDIEGGRWKIDTGTSQMIFYKADNVTEVARFNLFDSAGQPASDNVFERRRVQATTTSTTTTSTTTTSTTTTI